MEEQGKVLTDDSVFHRYLTLSRYLSCAKGQLTLSDETFTEAKKLEDLRQAKVAKKETAVEKMRGEKSEDGEKAKAEPQDAPAPDKESPLSVAPTLAPRAPTQVRANFTPIKVMFVDDVKLKANGGLVRDVIKSAPSLRSPLV